MKTEKFGIEISIDIDSKYGADFYAHNLETDVSSQVEDFTSNHNVFNTIKNIENANSLEELTEVSKCANEVANFSYITSNNTIINNIVTGLNMGLTESEKNMVAFGEARGEPDFELEYADIVDELHRYCTGVKYSDIIKMSEYQISRLFAQFFMDCMLKYSTGLPYNQAMHQNWNYEYGTDI